MIRWPLSLHRSQISLTSASDGMPLAQEVQVLKKFCVSCRIRAGLVIVKCRALNSSGTSSLALSDRHPRRSFAAVPVTAWERQPGKRSGRAAKEPGSIVFCRVRVIRCARILFIRLTDVRLRSITAIYGLYTAVKPRQVLEGTKAWHLPTSCKKSARGLGLSDLLSSASPPCSYGL